jgi:hypothetical protein
MLKERKMKRQKGVTLFVVMIILIITTLLAMSSMEIVTMEVKQTKNFQDSVTSLMEAENGLSVAKNRLRTDPMGTRDDLENGIDLVGTGSLNIAATYDYIIQDLQDATETLKVARITSTGNMVATGARRTVHQWAMFLNSPVVADAALTLYDSGNVTLKGNPEIDGHDHGVPNNFNCNGNGCQDTPAIPANDVTGIYSENDLSNLNLIGTPTLDGSPAQQVGGGTNDAGYWEQYVIDAQGYTSAINGSAWGTRDSPVVHIITQDMGIMGNTDGAGILIIKDAAVAFGGNFHFEGRIIILSTTGAGASITMGGTSRIYGSMVVVGPNTTIDFGSAGTPELMYSEEALGNIANTITWKVVGWVEEQR